MKKPKHKYCETPYCRHKAANGKKCWTCTNRLKRKRSPMKAAFADLRSNAKRRGKQFDLTFEQFKQFCYETDYITGRGRSKESFTIDRIDNDKGYTVDNIRILSKSENSSKRDKKILHYDWQNKTAFVTSQAHIEPDDDLPF